MARKRLMLTLGMAVWVAACADTTAPPSARPELGLLSGTLGSTTSTLTNVIHPLRWRDLPGGPELSARIASQGGGFAPLGEGGTVSFWAVRGEDQVLELRYRNASGQWSPYATFHVPADALRRRPDGSLVVWGDSVLISVNVDRESLVLHMEPTGLQFSQSVPAHLTWWYTGADPDYDGNGTVDLLDALLEQTKLGIRVQEDLLDPWVLLDAAQSLLDERFDADLKHFSGYAVSW